MWKFIYNGFLQWLTTTWAAYVTRNSSQGRLVKDIFFNDIYQWSGILLVLICVISCILYYFYFNKKFGNYHTRKTWGKWMFTTALLVGLATFIVGYFLLRSFLCPTTALIVYLSLINFLYALGLFGLLSLVCQLLTYIGKRVFSYDLSPMASRTPI